MLVRFWRMKIFHRHFRIAGYLLCLVVLALDSSALAEATNSCKIEIAGVRVVAMAPGNKDNLRAFNWSPGVTVAMLVTTTEGWLLSCDHENSKLNVFTDDKGGDLLAGDSRARFDLGSGQSFDHTNALLLEVRTRELPTKGAIGLNLSGKIFLVAASQTKQFTADEMDFMAGTEFGLGNLKLTISKVVSTATGSTLTLEANQDLSSISQLEFMDEQGNKVESRRSGSSVSTSPSGTLVRWSFTLNKKLEHGKISATCWTDLKTVEVPFSIKTGVGL